MKRVLMGIVIVGMVLLSRLAAGGEITVRLPNGVYVTKEVTSMKEARFNGMVAQKFDLSCGAASLATILGYYDDQVEEVEVVKYMLTNGDQEKIAEKGFSLMDLKRYAEHRDYLASGYKEVPLEKLRELKVPSIVLLNSRGYSHFVVLKGIEGNKAYVADPAAGNRSIDVEDLEEQWNGVIFVVVNQDGQAPSEMVLDATVSAPANQIKRIRQPGVGGYSSFPNRGEF